MENNINLTNDEIDKRISELLGQKTFPNAVTADGVNISIGQTYYFHNEPENKIDTKTIPVDVTFTNNCCIDIYASKTYYEELYSSKEEAIKDAIRYLESRVTRAEKILADRIKILEKFKVNHEV